MDLIDTPGKYKLSVRQLSCLFVCLFVYLSVCLPVCLSVCQKRECGITITSTAVTFFWGESRMNLVDTTDTMINKFICFSACRLSAHLLVMLSLWTEFITLGHTFLIITLRDISKSLADLFKVFDTCCVYLKWTTSLPHKVKMQYLRI